MKEIVKTLLKNHETISTMESCTGGGVVNAITNVVGASEVLLFSAVTYSNKYKIKMGVSKETINKYTVYSLEVAKEMSYNIAQFTNSTYGIGVTGKINNEDKQNLKGDINTVYVSIYNTKDCKYYLYKIKVTGKTREENKQILITFIIDKLKIIIN